jgi:hypothetical protein
MKIDKNVLSKIVEFCKEHPNATFMSGIGITVGAVMTVALGGYGYILDMKNDIMENMIDNKEEN